MINKHIEIPEFQDQHIRFELVFQDKVDESYIDIYDFKLDAVRATLTKAVNQEKEGITFVLTDKDNNAMAFTDSLPKHLEEASFDIVLVHFTLAYIEKHIEAMKDAGALNDPEDQEKMNDYWIEVQSQLKYESE